MGREKEKEKRVKSKGEEEKSRSTREREKRGRLEKKGFLRKVQTKNKKIRKKTLF